MTTDILQTIVAHKRIEIAHQEEAVSRDFLIRQLETNPPRPAKSLKQSLASSPTGIIAEFKRRSPSKGWIAPQADPAVIVPGYEKAGASGISVLTDQEFFGGSLKDLQTIRPLVQLPVLRKDFIISPYQLYQAKVTGADVVLLIAADLTTEECKELGKLAHQLEMEVLLEIHTENELDYLNEYVDLIGVNNRNLGTFHTDVENSFRLAKKLPKELVWVSESGISQPDTLKQLREAGFRGFLMGERFMKTLSPAQALSDFLQAAAL